MLVTVFKDSHLDPNGHLKVMCCVNLAAGVIVIPMVLAISVWSEVATNNAFCSLSGVFTNSLHGASMLNVCAINYERQVVN